MLTNPVLFALDRLEGDAKANWFALFCRALLKCFDLRTQDGSGESTGFPSDARVVLTAMEFFGYPNIG